MRSLTIVALLALVFVTAANAEMTLKIKSAQTIRVFMDGRYKGFAPMKFQNLPAGEHELEVENVDTKEYKIFKINVSSDEDVVRTYHINFNGRTRIKERVVLHRDYVAAPVMTGRRQPPAPPVVQIRPTYCPPAPAPAPVYRERRRVIHRPSRQKVRTRNAILAAGVANEMFNDGRRRKDVRKGAIAATILHEIFAK